MKEAIDIPREPDYMSWTDELRNVFLRSGFADQRNGRHRLLPCATGTFVNSSESSPTCKNCSAGKLQYFLNQLRERPMYMNTNMNVR